MKNQLLATFACAALAGAASAQVQDIGLTMDGGVLTVIYGQDCGPVGCTPFVAGPFGAGQTRTLTHYSEPVTLYAVAIGLPGPCLQVPGFDNPLLLQNPLVLDWGVTPSPPFVALPCQQTMVSVPYTLPANAPPGVVLRFQSFGQSVQTGGWAFGPALEFTTL